VKRFIAVFAALLPALSLAAADTLTWTGAANDLRFTTPGNWSPARAPAAQDDCVIPPGEGTINTVGILEIHNLQTARNISIGGCSRLTLTGGLTLVGGPRVSLSGACLGLIFESGTQSIAGDGEILILTNAVTSTIRFATQVQATISSGVTLSFDSAASGTAASLQIDAGCRVFNQGTIRSLKSGGRLTLTGSGELVNQGTISVSNGGTLRLEVSKWNSEGTLASARATLALAGIWSSTGQIVISEATAAVLQGTWTKSGSISAEDSTLSFEGGWSNFGAVSLVNGTWRVGGSSPGLGYDAVLSNACGATFSNPATLRICSADLNGDGMVDDTDFTIFISAYDTLVCP